MSVWGGVFVTSHIGYGRKFMALYKYGLKQSPRAWFVRFAKVMKELGYKQS